MCPHINEIGISMPLRLGLHTTKQCTLHSPNELTFRYEVPHFTALVPHLSTPDIFKSELFQHLEDDRDHIRSLMRQSQERNKCYYDRSVMHESFDEGKIVYIDQQILTPGLSRKLTKLRLQAYRVIRPLDYDHRSQGKPPYLYHNDLQFPRTGKVDVYHVNRLRRFPNVKLESLPDLQEPSSVETDPHLVPDHEDDVYKVDRLVRQRFAKDGTREYLVKWTGYSHKYNIREPAADISPELIAQFQKKSRHEDSKN